MHRITIIETAPSLDVFYAVEGTHQNNGAVCQVSGDVSTIQTGSKFRPSLRQHPGGKGINVANVLSRLLGKDASPQVDLHLFCQETPLTHAILQMLHADNSLSCHVGIQHHPVGTCAPRICANAAITQSGHMKHEFNFSPHVGLDLEERKALLERVKCLNRKGDWIVLAGTPPKNGNSHEGDPKLFMEILKRLDQTHVVLDTSGESLAHCIRAKFDHLKMIMINDQEAGEVGDALERFTGISVITDQKGANVYQKNKQLGRVQVRRKPHVKCTLGAGDSVTAGFLLRYMKSRDALEALKYSQAVAQTLITSIHGIQAITPKSVKRHIERLALA